MNLPKQNTDGYYELHFWSKIDTSFNEGTGTIMFTTTDTTGARPMVNVTAESVTWTRYSSAEPLFCPSTDHMRLEIYCGGKMSVFMLLDCLTIVKVE